MDHAAGGFYKTGFAYVVASFFLVYHGSDVGGEFVVSGACVHAGSKIVIEQGEETRPDLAIGGQAYARTMAAEGMRYGRDDADLSQAVIKGVPAGCLAQAMGKLTQGTKAVQRFQNLIHSDHNLGRPNPVLFERHELDKADHYTFLAGETSELNDLVFIESAQKNTVDFDRMESGAPGGPDAGKDIIEAIGNPCDARELFRIDGIHADRHATQTGSFQRRGQIGQKVSVGGDGEIELLTVGRAQLSQIAHEVHQAMTQQGFATGNTNFFDAKLNEDLDHAQVIGHGQVSVKGTFVSCPAIDATVIAAVCDADAEVSDEPPVFVG